MNPIMNAVAKAFKRQRHQGNLNGGSQNIETDTLLNADKQGLRDDDETMNLPKDQARGQYTQKRVCFLFQTGDCTFKKCCYRRRLLGSRMKGLFDLPSKDSFISNLFLLPLSRISLYSSHLLLRLSGGLAYSTDRLFGRRFCLDGSKERRLSYLLFLVS